MSRIAVCTLYEGHYHFGVAALVNSLYNHGFRGTFFIGYRGSLPPWCQATYVSGKDTLWPAGCYIYNVAEGMDLHFLPVDTTYHLTNYKAQFMLELIAGPAQDAKGIAYFDPDIIIRCRWTFFEKWMSHGVALVHEIVHNDMPETHPVRLEWKRVITKINRVPKRRIHSYINGGFCGVIKENNDFIKVWAELINIAVDIYKADPKAFSSFDRTYPFWSIDQDAINISAMCCDAPISEMGPDGMDFIYSGWVMSHAVGTPKPWKKNFLLSSILKAIPPTIADRTYWSNVSGPISPFSKSAINVKQFSMLISRFISRFYLRH
jgi:hypothetical protein